MITSMLRRAQLSGGCAATAEPNQVGGLTATASGQTTINLAWSADSTPSPNAATSYVVERSIDGLGSWSTIATNVTTNSYVDSGLGSSVTRHYRVSSVNCFGGGLPSATANATTASSTYNVEYLVVAGGGGGSRGGGGAGGYRTASGFMLTPSVQYTITVGAGGAGVNSNLGSAVGNNGSNSVFSTITSDGGGGGGGGGTGARNGNSGGSGGGAAHDGTTAGTGGTGTSGQGNNGGSPNTSFLGSPFSMAGGGGSSAAGGANTSASVAGSGGNGTASSISGGSVIYAGGGGGGVFSAGGTAGTGGTGGGGAGAVGNGNGTNGTANRGGGGGGGAGTVGNVGGNGGSGVVILRVPAANYSGTTTGSPTVTDDGSTKVLTFTASGSYTG